MATESRLDGTFQWRDFYFYENIVAYAKKQKINCFKDAINVATNNNQCTLDNLQECNIRELCGFATSSIGDEKEWEKRRIFQTAVEYAKANGYSCGIKKEEIKKEAKISKPQSCFMNPKLCTIIELCNLATKIENGKK